VITSQSYCSATNKRYYLLGLVAYSPQMKIIY